jgi:hypothetical protein
MTLLVLVLYRTPNSVLSSARTAGWMIGILVRSGPPLWFMSCWPVPDRCAAGLAGLALSGFANVRALIEQLSPPPPLPGAGWIATPVIVLRNI